MDESGVSCKRYYISDTAEYGDLTRGPRIITDAVKAEMKNVLAEIQDGRFAEEWVAESKGGRAKYHALQKAGSEHPIEKVGKELRSMMPFISAGKQRVEDVSGG